MKKIINNKKIIYIAICLLILLTTIFISFKINYHNTQEELLKKEITTITQIDLINDDINIKTKTSGNYSIVEKNIKSYYQDLSQNMKKIYSYLNDENLIQILSAKNLQNDGPNFEKSYQTISVTRENINTSMDKITILCSKKKITNHIKESKLDSQHQNLYFELVATTDNIKTLNNKKEEIQEIKDNLSIFLDKVEIVLNLLKDNSDSWYFKNDELYFKTTTLVNQYNDLYKDLNTFVTEKFSKYESNN